MSAPRSMVDVLHWMTHRVPGVPAHRDNPTGHQGRSPRGKVHGQPRVMVGWQRRIAAFFGQDLG